MWNYEKRLQYPVNIKTRDPKIAQIIISQFGGPDGELAASMRYLSQRYSMPYKQVKGVLTDIGISLSLLHILKNRFSTPQKKKMYSVHSLSIPLPQALEEWGFTNGCQLTDNTEWKRG